MRQQIVWGVAVLLLGIVLGAGGYQLADSEMVTARLGCRDLTDADFYQPSTSMMGMWAVGARIQMDDTRLWKQVEKAGYQVYIPLCRPSWERVVSEGQSRGMHPTEMPPWELEMNVRLKP